MGATLSAVTSVRVAFTDVLEHRRVVVASIAGTLQVRPRRAAVVPPKMRPFYVTEDEEQTLKHQVQTIFFGCTDRLKAKFGSAGRAEVMAMVARGFGQCLRATCVKEGRDPRAEAPQWVDAFFEHLGETGVKVNRKKVKPVTDVLAGASALAKDFRDDEEWFFPQDRTWMLKAWLVAAFRVVPTMRPLVQPERACGIFLAHFAEGVAEDIPPAKGPGEQPGPGRAKKPVKKKAAAKRPAPKKAKRG